MFRRLVVAAFFNISVYLISGCAGSTKTLVGKENVPQLSGTKITQVTLTNREVVRFDHDGAYYYERYGNKRRVIVGRITTGENAVIALNEVRNVYVEQNVADDGSAAAFPTFLIVGIVVAAVINGAE
ncbi:MAG: hypothetical protein ACREOI_14110 [bacterium]